MISSGIKLVWTKDDAARRKRLDAWTHNKAIQKSVESYRVTPEHKEYLKRLRIKK